MIRAAAPETTAAAIEVPVRATSAGEAAGRGRQDRLARRGQRHLRAAGRHGQRAARRAPSAPTASTCR